VEVIDLGQAMERTAATAAAATAASSSGDAAKSLQMAATNRSRRVEEAVHA
jgi:hypothetical protein